MAYQEQNIISLRASGREWMAAKMNNNEVTFCDKVRLLFSNLWHCNGPITPLSMGAIAEGYSALFLAGLAVPGPGWFTSAALATSLLLIGTAIFMTCLFMAILTTRSQLTEVDSPDYFQGVENDLLPSVTPTLDDPFDDQHSYPQAAGQVAWWRR